MRTFGLVIAILMSMLCEITKCFQIIKVASKRQDQNYSSKFYSSTQNQETEKRQRRSIQIPTSGNKATLISRTVPVTAEYSLTVWEWENPAQVMESYWEAVQYANDDCFLTGGFKSPSSQQLLDPFGLVSWPGSVVAAQELYKHKEIIKGKKVLILGAGVGLEAQAAALFGAKEVLATDIHPTTLAQLEFGVEQEERIDHGVVETQVLDLYARDEQPIPFSDVLIVADVLYNEQLASQVVKRIVEAWAKNEKLCVLVTDSQRFVPTFVNELNEGMKKVGGPLSEWKEQTLLSFTGSGVMINEDQTYDVKVQKLWIGLS